MEALRKLMTQTIKTIQVETTSQLKTAKALKK